MFGPLKIVPSADFGEMKPQQSEAAIFNWKWYYSASGFVIWLVLILALIIPKSNRDLHILLIFLPIVAVNLLWMAFKKIFGFSSSDAQQLDLLLHSVVIGVAVLWLLAKQVARFRGSARLLLSLSVFAVVAGFGILPSYTGFSDEAIMLFILVIFYVFTLLLAMAVACRLCKGQYLPKRFMLWLGLWTLFGGIFALFGFITFMMLVTSSGPSALLLLEILLEASLAGLVFGLYLYILNLPFMILGFAHPFFRERFCACLSLKPRTAIVESVASSDHIPNTQSST